MNLRFDTEKLSIGNTVIPGTGILPAPSTGGATGAAGTVVASYIGSTRALLSAVDMLSQKQVARSVAEPNVLTLSGESASVLVGGEVPVPDAISNQVAVQSSFSFRQYGVRMDIRPTVDEHGAVALEVAPGIVTPSQVLGNTSVPGFTIQRVETTARVPAGESLVLGGLLSSAESSQERGIPGLDRIPLFRWQRKITENTELLFVITPRIVDGANGNDVRLPALTYQDSPNRLGISGLDTSGVPVSFKGRTVSVMGREGLCAELRSAPGQSGTVADCLLPGSAVVVLDSSADWQRVRTESGGQGWMESSRLRAPQEPR
jgi:Flp pilus assembly secretin CpaC